MLFNNFEVYTPPAEWEKILDREFPDFDTIGAKLTWVDAKMVPSTKVDMRRPTKPLGTTSIAPQPVGHRMEKAILVDKKPVFLQCSHMMPEIQSNNKKTFKGGSRVVIGENFLIQPGQRDVLTWLYFAAPYIENNGATEKSAMPEYQFVFPEKKALAERDGWKKDNELKRLVYEELSEEQIIKCMKGLEIEPQGSLILNQKLLISKVSTGSQIYKDNFYDLVKSTTSKKEKVEEIEEEFSVSDFVSELKSEGLIVEEEGKWRSKSLLNGELNKTPFWQSSATGDDAFFALVKQLETNSELLAKLKKLKP